MRPGNRNRHRWFSAVLSVGLVLLCALASFAEGAAFAPAQIFCDQMVLQRDTAVPVWGTAAPAAAVTVTFAGQEKTAVTGADGKWTLKLDPMAARLEPSPMTLSDGQRTLTINGVLVGEVWLCSGQSNMVYQFGGMPPGFSTDYPLIRGFTVPRSIALEPQTAFVRPRVMAGHDFQPATSWFACSPGTAGAFTGVGLYAAIEMFKTLQVPIGVLNCSFNGSTAALWVPTDVLRQDPRYAATFQDADAALDTYRKNIDQYEADQGLFEHMQAEMAQAGTATSDFADTEDRGLREGWMKPDLDVAAWPKLTWGWTNVPPVYLWDGDCVVWIRMLFAKIKPEGDVRFLGGDYRNCSVRLFFNGAELKPTGEKQGGQDVFVLPRAEIKGETGYLTIRAFSNHKIAGIWQVPSSPDMLVLPTPWGSYRLAESVVPADKFRLAGHKYPPGGMGGYPGSRFNAMMNPLIPYALRGFLWYQGESEVMGGIKPVRLYAHTLPLLVQSWRAAWGGEPKPFVAVQLAGHGYDPQRNFLMEMRESQKAVLALPATALSPAFDIREPGNVHPGNKYDIGTRAGRTLLALAYGQKVEFSGPVYTKMAVQDGRARVFFDHVGGGLAVGEKTGQEPVKFLPGPEVPQFLIAGPDLKFVPAQAKIDGATVLVWSDAVPAPVAVRYAWTNMPPNPLLYNREGLPACSFRTDAGDFKDE